MGGGWETDPCLPAPSRNLDACHCLHFQLPPLYRVGTSARVRSRPVRGARTQALQALQAADSTNCAHLTGVVRVLHRLPPTTINSVRIQKPTTLWQSLIEA